MRLYQPRAAAISEKDVAPFFDGQQHVGESHGLTDGGGQRLQLFGAMVFQWTISCPRWPGDIQLCHRVPAAHGVSILFYTTP